MRETLAPGGKPKERASRTLLRIAKDFCGENSQHSRSPPLLKGEVTSSFLTGVKKDGRQTQHSENVSSVSFCYRGAPGTGDSGEQAEGCCLAALAAGEAAAVLTVFRAESEPRIRHVRVTVSSAGLVRKN